MESALMIVPPSFSASASASADLPLAVGPAIRMTAGSLTGLKVVGKIVRGIRTKRPNNTRYTLGHSNRRRRRGQTAILHKARAMLLRQWPIRAGRGLRQIEGRQVAPFGCHR